MFLTLFKKIKLTTLLFGPIFVVVLGVGFGFISDARAAMPSACKSMAIEQSVCAQKNGKSYPIAVECPATNPNFIGCFLPTGEDPNCSNCYQQCCTGSETYNGPANTTNSCFPQAATECGNGASDGFAYKCFEAGTCNLYVGSEIITPGTGSAKVCSTGVCCKLPRCPDTSNKASAAVKPPSEYKLANPLGTTSIPTILGKIIKTFLGIVGGIALMVFVYGGLMWMTARGDQGQVKKGQDAIKAAATGLFIIIFAYTLAGYLVTALTSEQTIIASQEGRGTTETPTQANQQAATIGSQLKESEQKQEQGQAGAGQAGAQAGITPTPGQTQPSACENLTGMEKIKCEQGELAGFLGSGQAAYNTPNPGAGLPGGQKDCTGNPNCSQVGWITVCNEKVFDTGYGTYNNASCMAQADCTSQKGTVLKTLLFGSQCGVGNVCCKVPK
jgi:hypothetical protein